MRKVITAILLITLLCGCQDENAIAPAMQLRNSILNADGCRFVADITADYGEMIYTFSLECISDSRGNIEFVVTEPKSIEGITGRINAEGGALTFDNEILAFPVLANGYITPVSVPWLLVRTIRGGYIRAGGQDNKHYKVQMDDSYEEDPLTIDLWLDNRNLPVCCEFLWNNRRILTAEIKSFTYM